MASKNGGSEGLRLVGGAANGGADLRGYGVGIAQGPHEAAP